MPELKEGDKAPDFSLDDDSGAKVKLSGLKGRPVVLYFYPKDDTPGCTKEACDFRDSDAQLKKAGAVVLGVSPDGPASHAKFKKKFSLPFPLLADPDKKAAKAYGVWGEKILYGRTFMGIIRSTFLIDPKGRVARAWRKVKVDGHKDEVLEALKSL